MRRRAYGMGCGAAEVLAPAICEGSEASQGHANHARAWIAKREGARLMDALGNASRDLSPSGSAWPSSALARSARSLRCA